LDISKGDNKTKLDLALVNYWKGEISTFFLNDFMNNVLGTRFYNWPGGVPCARKILTGIMLVGDTARQVVHSQAENLPG
jgi:hypothetical protein